MTVAELGDRVSGAAELTWELLEAIEPWGERRADLRLAILCWTMGNCHYKKPPPFTTVLKQVNELLGNDTHEQTDEEMAAMFNLIAAAS